MSGGFNRLASLRQALARLASGQVMPLLSTRMATEIQKQLIDGFKNQCDPYDRPWASRKNPRGGWPILRKNDHLLMSYRTQPTGRGLRVTADNIAAYHETGTRRMQARMTVPDPALGLGERWSAGLDHVAETTMRQLVEAV